MQNSFQVCIIRNFKWTRVPYSHYKGEVSHFSSKGTVSARLQNTGNEICRLLKMAVKESLAVLHVLREVSLSCQLKCTWQGKGNLGVLAHPVAEKFKTSLGIPLGFAGNPIRTWLFEDKQCVKTYWISNFLCEGSQYVLLCKFPWFFYDADERAGVHARGDWSTWRRCLGSAELSPLTHPCKTSEVYSACICCREERSNSSGDFSILQVKQNDFYIMGLRLESQLGWILFNFPI